MKNLKIYPIIILISLVAAIYFPVIYKDMLGKRGDYHRINYSPLSEEFVKFSILKGEDRKIVYSDIGGIKDYTKDEYMAHLPFLYFFDLLKIGEFPKEFSVYSDQGRLVRREKIMLRMKPEDVNEKYINLKPLFESNPKYNSLQMSKDLFSLDEKGISFIIGSTNLFDEEKSERFSKKFISAGAEFPLKKAYGNPTTRKAFDEGYFVTDSKNRLFHLKMIDGDPFVKKVDTKGLDIKYILIKENSKREFYGLVVSKDSSVYMLMYDDYKLVKLPVTGYDYNSMNFNFYANPEYRVVTLEYTDHKIQEKIIKTTVMDLDYEKVDENIFTYSLKGDHIYELVKEYLFPFELSIVDSKNYFAYVELKKVNSAGVVLSLITALCYLLYIKISRRELKEYMFPFILIGVFGIYGIISLLFFGRLLGNKRI